ncbi:MAG: glycosyltransferase, partial [Planctomycetaceae bacterium]|nr:glycosyltransferase [Planctomycetaceae bacterium]
SRYLDDLNCDILHLHVPNPAMTMAVLKMRRPAPMVVTYHSDVVGMPLRKLLFHPWDRRLMLRAKIIAATNPRMAESSTRLAGHQERVRVVPLGIPLERFVTPSAEVERRAREIRAEIGGPLWLICGRLVAYKGHSIALQALADVPGTLVVIGDGPLRQKLQRQADELQLGDRVRFLGRVACDHEVAAYYRAATALWMSSIMPSEAFGLVQVEAMASGCPVINTEIPGSGVPWVSRHDETGFTAPVGDARAFARLSQRLLDEPELRERFSRNARARALEEFNHHKMADRWQDLYDDVLRDRRRDRHGRDRHHAAATSFPPAG